MSWYYNSSSGKVQQENDIVAWPALHAGLDWHGPFKTEKDAETYYNTNKGKNPGWVAPTTSTSQALGNQVTDTLGGLNLGGWFVRIGEILLGLVLIGVGVAKLTGAANVVSKVAKVAV